MDPTLPPIPAAPQAAAYANPPAGAAAAAAAPQAPAGEYEEIREQVCFIIIIYIFISGVAILSDVGERVYSQVIKCI